MWTIQKQESTMKNISKVIWSDEEIRNAKTFDELLDVKYGTIGTEIRDKYEAKADNFVTSEMLKEAGKDAPETP